MKKPFIFIALLILILSGCASEKMATEQQGIKMDDMMLPMGDIIQYSEPVLENLWNATFDLSISSISTTRFDYGREMEIMTDIVNAPAKANEVILPKVVQVASVTQPKTSRASNTERTTTKSAPKAEAPKPSATPPPTQESNGEKEQETKDEKVSKEPQLPSEYVVMEATAYTHTGNKTFTGTVPKVGTIAVDPKVIPLGTRLYVEGYGYGIAEDIGSKVKGNIIDVFLDTYNEAIRWGTEFCRIHNFLR
jgi:3D (Asp-Asp-Asp) domain-containing protein